MKTLLLAIGFILILGMGLFAQTATPPSAGDGTSGNPYQIASLENLYWIYSSTDNWNDYYIQTENIDASATGEGGAWGTTGWTPIGNSTTTFTGSYDGQNHTIDGLYINRSSGTTYIGLFGYTTGATINNVGLINVNIVNSSWYVGALVGWNESTTVSNCYSTGSVSSSGLAGGLVCYNTTSSTLSNCHSTASVSGIREVGGLVGYNVSSTVNDCYSTGSVTCSGGGDSYAGGLVGENSSSTLRRCYSTGNVTSTGSGRFVGGFVGLFTGSNATDCYSTSSVSSAGGDVGGLVGKNQFGSTISNCYSIGSVVGVSDVGGLVGSSSSSTTNNSFWNTETSGQPSSAGGTGKTTAEMKTHTTFTAAGWDFEAETANGTNNYWDMDYSGSINNGYPFLSWQNGGDVSLPVELSSFSVHAEGRSIVLEWTTESEVDNLGFILERSVGADPDPPGAAGSDWQPIASYLTNDALKGQGNTSSRTEYAFTDQNVESGKEYSYRLSDVSTQGEITVYASLSVKMDVLPEKTEMEKAYPNPFNPRTYIAYRLAEDTNVNISVFDMLGRQVKTLHAGYQKAGSYHVYWNGTTESGMKSPSGGYIIRMLTENTMQIQKMMFVK